MKAAVILSFVATAFAAGIEPRACNADNCARQVTGTRAGLLPITSRQSDCSSFMTSTVVPDATTTTVTVTVDGDAPARFKRDINYRAETEIPTAIPAYASSCDDNVEYSSACSCWGITAGVSTAPTPTETATVTVTQDYCEDL